MRKGLCLVVTALLVLAAAGCKRTLKLEGKVTGFKPGTDTLMLHVTSEKGATVTCEPPGYGCKTIDVGALGQADAELEMTGTEKKVYLKGRIGPAQASIVVDPAAGMPPAVKVLSGKYVDCIARDCKGTIENAPAGQISLTAPAGTLVEIGTDKVTVGATGKIDAPVNITPALKDVALSRVFARDVVTYGSTTLTLTFPDKVKASTKVDLTTETAQTILPALFKTVANGPLLFPWEKGTAVKGRPVAVYNDVGRPTVSPPDGTLADVRVIVLSVDKSARVVPCSYVNKNTGAKATANLTVHDQNATAYERATGRKLGTRAFAASATCDWETTAKAGTALNDQGSWPDPGPIAQWGASLAR